ncbi:MAG: hypothetical protein Q8M15_14400 [Bacteroidota bacterium]|nr:hypothetical protein [Bacteroidota bacterium]
MTDKIILPFNPGDVVILNSSPDIPMTVLDCFDSSEKATNGNPILTVNVVYLDRNCNPVRKGFPHNILSLFKPVTDFIQPIGFKNI